MRQEQLAHYHRFALDLSEGEPLHSVDLEAEAGGSLELAEVVAGRLHPITRTLLYARMTEVNDGSRVESEVDALVRMVIGGVNYTHIIIPPDRLIPSKKLAFVYASAAFELGGNQRDDRALFLHNLANDIVSRPKPSTKPS